MSALRRVGLAVLFGVAAVFSTAVPSFAVEETGPACGPATNPCYVTVPDAYIAAGVLAAGVVVICSIVTVVTLWGMGD